MPRPPRLIFANEYYHVLNRANRRAEVFHEPADFSAFLGLIAKAQQRIEVPLLAACLMPNHVHLVMRPAGAKDIPRWMQWLFTTHARHYHEKHGTTGHVWQGRYKHVPVQSDHHLLMLIRYAERNALRWRLLSVGTIALAEPPLALPASWTEWVNTPQTAAELEAIRTSVNRQRPFGDPEWVAATAKRELLDQSLVDVGRPRRSRSGTVC